MTAPNDKNIFVHHVTRVEGHGNIKVDIKNGKLVESQLQIVESPRFFESLLLGRRYTDVALITSRICGICSTGHTLASINATEDAFGYKPSEQTILLRKLLHRGENLQSHVLHLYCLVAPDLFRVGSVVPLAATHTDVVLRALRMKKLANDLAELVGGRAVHPQSAVPGGFTSVPKVSALLDMKKRLEAAVPDLTETAKLILSVADKFPNLQRQTEYVSLQSDNEYALIAGDICSSDAGRIDIHNYRKVTNEKVVDHSAAKHCAHKRSSYAVGALSRVNNNFDKLCPMAKDVAKMFGFKTPCNNPFMNNLAQLLEAVDSVVHAIQIIDTLVKNGVKDVPLDITPKAGTGVGAVEVPRGILFHEYTYDAKGFITNANCIIPTGQNLANIEDDMRTFVPQIVNDTKEEIAFKLEMLVRAYDPCISCATHLLDVEFVD